jgi:hypothetical protein
MVRDAFITRALEFTFRWQVIGNSLGNMQLTQRTLIDSTNIRGEQITIAFR